MQGKFGTLWKGTHIGGLAKSIQLAHFLNLAGVSLKIGDHHSDHSRSFPDMAEAVAAFKAEGFWVAVWHYIYGGVWIDKDNKPQTFGSSPEAEADFARRMIDELEPCLYLVDAEREYKVSNQQARAIRFMNRLGAPGIPVALNSYRFPNVHPELPWAEFLFGGSGCQFHSPQVYHGPGRAVHDLNESMRQLKLRCDLPFLPMGRAYIGDGHADPKPHELIDFFQRCLEVDIPAASFWSMDHLVTQPGGQARAQAIAAFDWPVSQPDPEPPNLEARLINLEQWAREQGYQG
jgi:hypothetical protein